MDTATRIRRGFFRLAIAFGVVAAVPGGFIGLVFSGPPVPEDMARETELQRELDLLKEKANLPDCSGIEEVATELKCLAERGDALPPRAQQLERRLRAIDRYRDRNPGIWYQQPKWLRAILTTAAGTGIAFLVAFGVIRALGWVVAGFF